MLLLISYGYSQDHNVQDGIKLASSCTNRTSFYYGEPLLFHFYAENISGSTKMIWKPLRQVNLIIKIKNESSGIEYTDQFDFPGSNEYRHYYNNNEPNESKAFAPTESYIYDFLVGEGGFPTKTVYETQRRGAPSIGSYGHILPVGEYKILVEYTLLPTNVKVVVDHSFEILEIPIDEQQAFQAYTIALAYTSNSHSAFGDGSYNPNHQKSLESFITRFPNSRFAKHADHIIALEVYPFPGSNMPSETIRKKKMKSYFSSTHNDVPELKLQKAVRIIPITRTLFSQTEKDKMFSDVLINLKHDDPTLSEIFIRKGKGNFSEKVLINHAKKQKTDN